MSVLVDSDILIEVSRGKDTDLVSRWTGLSRSDEAVLYSPISVAELWARARPAEHDALDNLFGALTCVPMDAETGCQAGEYLRRYRKSHGVELGDALIACRRWRNRRHALDAKPEALPDERVGLLLGRGEILLGRHLLLTGPPGSPSAIDPRALARRDCA